MHSERPKYLKMTTNLIKLKKCEEVSTHLEAKHVILSQALAGGGRIQWRTSPVVPPPILNSTQRLPQPGLADFWLTDAWDDVPGHLEVIQRLAQSITTVHGRGGRLNWAPPSRPLNSILSFQKYPPELPECSCSIPQLPSLSGPPFRANSGEISPRSARSRTSGDPLVLVSEAKVLATFPRSFSREKLIHWGFLQGYYWVTQAYEAIKYDESRKSEDQEIEELKTKSLRGLQQRKFTNQNIEPVNPILCRQVDRVEKVQSTNENDPIYSDDGRVERWELVEDVGIKVSKRNENVRLQGNWFSMGAPFCGRCGFMGLSPPNADPNKPSPNIHPGNLDPPLIPAPPALLPIPPNGLENPKNSAKMSSALLGLNLNAVGPSPPLKKDDPVAPLVRVAVLLPDKRIAAPLYVASATAPALD
ncbi:hypothetical protein M5K25_003690 [Dendrobium thyrsiflorum]|uniref:Uncharacterized protein n=1 Tax=Dendrobium thyrsiflorum TaxID=117978 RepID=A0ABD0VJP5_DENTH